MPRWLKFIEPVWKQMRSLSLKERRFETLEELTETCNVAGKAGIPMPFSGTQGDTDGRWGLRGG